MNAAANIAVGVAIAAASGLGGCRIGDDYEPEILPACVSGFEEGDGLAVRIGAVYDAKSDYLFEAQMFGLLNSLSSPSCGGLDGLATGSVLTFKLTGPADGSGRACSAWSAVLEAEVVTDKMHAGSDLPYFDGVTIAEATVTGNVGDIPVYAARGLFTPSGDPDGALVTAMLPPLVVARRLTFLDNHLVDNNGVCFDAWVATWEPAS